MRGYYSNLDQSTDRRALIETRLAPLLPELERVPALGVADLPAGLPHARKPSPTERRTAACFLSHQSVWRRIAADPAPGALVFEDDVRPLHRFADRLDAFAREPDLAFYDLVFVNKRMVEWRRDAGEPLNPFGLLAPLETVLTTWACAHEDGGRGLGHPLPHPGSEGYYLSRAGARKLAALAGRIACDVNVDWFKTSAAAARLPDAFLLKTMRALIRRADLRDLVRAEGGLHAAILDRPLVGADPNLPSVRAVAAE